MAQFYTLKQPQSPWGDYSDILISGMSQHSARKKKLIQLERTGPYVPPISFPGFADIVVTDFFRDQLKTSGLRGLEFQPVIKKQIVHLDWQEWDQTSEDPEEYPEGGEPESYILGRPHSAETSARMGDLWEVLLEENATVQRKGKPARIVLVESSWSGGDLFRSADVGYIYATEKAKAWLEKHVPEHVAFSEVEVV